MSTKPQIELFLENESGTQQVAYPFVESDHVSLSNGMDIDTMIRQDVSMPTVTHEDLSFKVGVGDQDVSSAIVDSSVAEMTIKGQTYQNILPEPSTHVLSNNKEMFKVNEGLDPNVEVVDGVSKSAILSGCTLVNGLSNPKKNQGKGFVTIVSPTHLIINHGENIAGEKASVIYEWFGGKMEDGVDYTLDIWILKNTMHRKTDPNASIGKINFNNYNSGFYSIPSSTLGHITYEVTTSKTNTGGKPYIETFATCEGELEIQMVVRQGRNLEPIEKHFEGMTSCKMPVLTTTGKNLFDGINRGYFLNIETVLAGWTLNDNGGVVDVSNIDKATISSTVIQTRFRFACTNTLPTQSGNTVRVYNGVNLDGNSSIKATIDCSNYKYLIINATDLSVIQVEEGTTATPYEPYKSNILHTTNLLSNTTLTQGCINTDGSLTTSGESASYSVFTEIMPVKPNTEYYIATDNADITYDRIAYYNSSKTFMRRSDTLYASKSTSLTIPNDTYYIRIAFYQGSGIQITPQQLGNAVCQEMVVLRSLPNGIKDTLNLNTGEYVQRIGEITFKNQTAWEVAGGYPNLYYYNTNDIGNANIYVGSGAIPNLYCDKMAVTSYSGLQQSTSGVKISNRGKEGTHSIAVYNSDITNNVVDFKAWLTQNPFTVQYELATPVVKTVDLSSSGNWEKVVLDGSENWARHGNYGSVTRFNVTISNMAIGHYHVFSDKFPRGTIGTNDLECVNNHYSANQFQLQIKTSRLTSDSVDGLKQYLSQNPLTVWYQTKTHLDSTQVKQPIFFADGHIMQSSGADNSLIPILDYQAKTSNSYVMDLLKLNTVYTIKATSASGNLLLTDGRQIMLSTNRTFNIGATFPSDKLIINKGSATDLMILEGDITNKTIPYFKGIKSTFEDESKIEVLSTGKNLADVTTVYTNMNSGYNDRHWTIVQKDENGFIAKVKNYSNTGTHRGFPASLKVYVEPNTTYYLSYDTKDNGVAINSHVYVYSNCETWGGSLIKQHGEAQNGFTFTTHSDTEYIVIGLGYTLLENNKEVEVSNLILSRSKTTYEPYKSNSTKIPLLSPLRSLPNGVCDEIVLDRENNKAKIVQRVEEIVLNGTEKWKAHPNLEHNKTLLFQSQTDNRQGKSFRCVSDQFPCLTKESIWDNTADSEGIQLGGGGTVYKRVDLRISKLKVSSNRDTQLQNYLNHHPTTVLYELATPIITEVDLEGFPYVYKDGHIFLNGEIAPVTEIKYSINQQHQIEASNQDIIRHQKEIDYLYKLIGEYVRVDYKNTLLSLNLELK